MTHHLTQAMDQLKRPTQRTLESMDREKGFTLIEVLVALFIVSLTLVSAFKASASLTQSAERQNSNFLAQLCVDNYLTGLRLSGLLPGTGLSEVNCPQNSQTLFLRISIDVTPNPSFRRVEAQVFSHEMPILKVTTVVGVL